MLSNVFLSNGSTNNGGWGMLIIYFVVIAAVFYFIAIRPQKKQKQQHNSLLSSLAIGDSILTTSGFYGVVIDIMDEVVIVGQPIIQKNYRS